LSRTITTRTVRSAAGINETFSRAKSASPTRRRADTERPTRRDERRNARRTSDAGIMKQGDGQPAGTRARRTAGERATPG